MTTASRAIVLVTATIVLTLSGGGSALPFAAGYSRDDGGESGAAAVTRASDVALALLGGGRVTGTEVDDEDSYYEVEVTLPDGSQVDVQLDESFAVVGNATDVENSDADG